MAGPLNLALFPVAIADRLLVEPLEVEEMVRGMARPGSQAERPTEGIVRLAGPGRVTEFGARVPPEVSVGDLISFPSYAGKEIINPRGFPPGAYLIVRQDEVQINYGPERTDSAGNLLPYPGHAQDPENE